MWTQNTEKIIKQPKSPNTLFIIIGDICFLKLKSIKRDNLYHKYIDPMQSAQLSPIIKNNL